MKPEHQQRRKIIREWMSLSKEKRQTQDQADAFATKAIERIPSVRDPHTKIMRWLLPRTGREGVVDFDINREGAFFTRVSWTRPKGEGVAARPTDGTKTLGEGGPPGQPQ
jgi:hypothetical protein